MRFLSLIFAGAVVVVACAEGDRGRDTDDDESVVSSSVGPGAGGGVPGTCNNGRLDEGEQCDGSEFGGTTCESLGLTGGTLACDATTCTIDATNCGGESCGDGIIGTAEECDGENLDGQSCATLGFSGGTLSCDGTCKFTGCNDEFAEDFEAGSLDTYWVTTGAAWTPSNVTPHGGTYCAKSGFIGDSQTSSLSTTLTFTAAGTVTFWHRESSEYDYDFLQFYIDSVMQAEWSGPNSWAMHTSNVAQGTHTFEWRYSKDGSLSDYEDSVYIDDITVTNGVAP